MRFYLAPTLQMYGSKGHGPTEWNAYVITVSGLPRGWSVPFWSFCFYSFLGDLHSITISKPFLGLPRFTSSSVKPRFLVLFEHLSPIPVKGSFYSTQVSLGGFPGLLAGECAKNAPPSLKVEACFSCCLLWAIMCYMIMGENWLGNSITLK